MGKDDVRLDKLRLGRLGGRFLIFFFFFCGLDWVGLDWIGYFIVCS